MKQLSCIYKISASAPRLDLLISWQFSLLFLTLTVLIAFSGCSVLTFPKKEEGCKMRAYADSDLPDYINRRFPLGHLPRLAVIPFDVPESFALPGGEDQHFGRELASLFQRELMSQGQSVIVELFNRDRWPGKRADFHSGNFQAIQLARDAGYDFVLVGQMEELINETDLSALTKVIDTSNGVTVWFGRTVAYSNLRLRKKALSDLTRGRIKDRPDLFYFPERAEQLAHCTIDRILHGESTQPESHSPRPATVAPR